MERKGNHLNASYTVEASVLMPFFVIIMAVILLIFRLYELQWGVGVSIWQVGQKLALCGETSEEGGVINELSAAALSDAAIAASDAPVSFVAADLLGILYADSEVTDKDIDIAASYRVPLPVGYRLMDHFNWGLNSRIRVRRWTGYDPHENDGDSDSLVYVTKSGSVYHVDINCKYLAPSIHSAAVSVVGGLRSKDGSKYYPCERCRGDGGICYYTDYGNVYHASLTCPSLRRDIRSMRLSEAQKKYPPCSKCGGKSDE